MGNNKHQNPSEYSHGQDISWITTKDIYLLLKKEEIKKEMHVCLILQRSNNKKLFLILSTTSKKVNIEAKNRNSNV